jgi:hypothetical protein
VPTPEVIALTDQLHAHLDRGDMTGIGPIDLGSDGIIADVEIAARLVLADVTHRAQEDRRLGRPAIRAGWNDLADQLRRLLRAVPRRS